MAIVLTIVFIILILIIIISLRIRCIIKRNEEETEEEEESSKACSQSKNSNYQPDEVQSVADIGLVDESEMKTARKEDYKVPDSIRSTSNFKDEKK